MEQKGRVNIFEETIAHMTYAQIEEAAGEGSIVLFPVGVIEEHGPHLPLAVDVYGSYLDGILGLSQSFSGFIHSALSTNASWASGTGG